MNIIQKISAALALVPLLVLAAGCNHSNDEPEYVFNSFVTFEGHSDIASSFTTQEKDDSELVTLTVNRVISELTVGTRYLITYSTPSGKAFVSGPITLYQVSGVANGGVTEATLEEIGKMMNSETTATPGRTGVYLNCPVSASARPKVFGLYVDEATLSNSVPDVYLCFTCENEQLTQAGLFLGSFSIKSLFDKAGVEAINFHYYASGELKTVRYNNPNKTIAPRN